MGPFGDKLATVLACLAALLMPLDGGGHLVCRCPNGQVKSFCLGAITGQKSGSCCCGGKCCSRHGGGKCCCCRTRGAGCNAGATCCGGRQAPRGQEPPPGRSVTAPCCVKTLTATDSPAVVPAKEAAGPDGRPLGDLPPLPGFVATPVAGFVFQALALVHSPGPPADLLTLLRRLLI